jgi:DNA-binding PadR family transcriptional regulator
MSELAAEGLIQVVRHRSNGAPAYRITDKGRQWIAGLNDSAD